MVDSSGHMTVPGDGEFEEMQPLRGGEACIRLLAQLLPENWLEVLVQRL